MTARHVPRVTLTKDEAAVSLGISLDHFERHVMASVRLIRCGRRVLIRVAELERWAQEHEAVALRADV